MNPIIFPIIIVAAVLLWVLLAALFKPLGYILEHLLNDVKKSFEEDKDKEEEDKKDE